MNAPLKRDEQIELMKTAAKRHGEMIAKWMKDSTVRSAFATPAKGQKERGYKMESVTVTRRCGTSSI